MQSLQAMQGLAYFLTGLFFIFLGLFNLVYRKLIIRSLQKKNWPKPAAILYFLVTWEILAGLFIMIGLMANYAALTLIILTIVSAFLFHPFWQYDGNERRNNLLLFATNLTVGLAAVLFIASGG